MSGFLGYHYGVSMVIATTPRLWTTGRAIGGQETAVHGGVNGDSAQCRRVCRNVSLRHRFIRVGDAGDYGLMLISGSARQHRLRDPNMRHCHCQV